MAETQEILHLTDIDMDSAVEEVAEFLQAEGIDRRRVLRARLILEEVLLRYRDEFGPDREFSLTCGKRFGTATVRLMVRGHSVDVLDSTGEGEYDLGEGFLTSLLGDDFGTPVYRYRNGHNLVILSLRISKQRPFWANPMLIATLAAVAIFFAMRAIDASLGERVLESVAGPVLSALMGVLSAITGPLLSLSLISGICALGSVSALKRTGARAMLRIMGWVVVMFVVTVAVSTPLYGTASGDSATAFNGKEIFDLLLSAIPSNLFAPFIEGNALQITVESVFAAICILALGDHSERIRELVIELNSLLFKMMFVFSKVLPLLVGLSIFKALVTTDVTQLATIGSIVAVSLGATLVLSVMALAWAAWRLHVSPVHFLKKSWPAVAIALTTGSSTTAMGENYRVCEKNLGVSKKVVDFWLPLGQALFAPSMIVPLVTGMYAVANMQGIAFGPSRVLILFILVFQLSIASPKVPGGIAATFTILLGQLGLPLDSVGVLMAANVFIVNAVTAFGMLVRDVEICDFAQGEKALDHEVLAA